MAHAHDDGHDPARGYWLGVLACAAIVVLAWATVVVCVVLLV